MNVIYIAIVVVAGYLLGSLSISILLSKNLLGRDVRRHGSGNAGLTNFYRTFGGPLTAVVIGVWVFAEPFTAKGAAGILLIVAAVSVVVLRSRKG